MYICNTFHFSPLNLFLILFFQRIFKSHWLKLITKVEILQLSLEMQPCFTIHFLHFAAWIWMPITFIFHSVHNTLSLKSLFENVSVNMFDPKILLTKYIFGKSYDPIFFDTARHIFFLHKAHWTISELNLAQRCCFYGNRLFSSLPVHWMLKC